MPLQMDAATLELTQLIALQPEKDTQSVTHSNQIQINLNMSATHFWINGKIKATSEAMIHVSDLGLLRGMGIFDYFLVEKGKAIFMKEHIDRFFRSAKHLDMTIPVSKSELAAAIKEVLQVNKEKNAAIRIVLTGGYAADGYTYNGQNNLLILQHNFVAHDPGLHQRGMHLMTYSHQRILPEVKSTNYLLPIILKKDMDAISADDVLYHFDNRVSETSRANFFIIDSKGVLITSVGNVLKGITRNKTIEVARQVMEVEVRPFTIEEMWAAEEAFITSTTKGILAVTKIDNKVFGNGQPGEKTLFLVGRLNNLMKTHVASSATIL